MRREIRILALTLGVFVLALSGSAAAAEDEVPTFTKDIAPIFQAKCQACHRPGYIAPMSLVTYAESRPWARSIKTRVETRQMPPWHIDKSVGIQDFQNDRSLTDAADRHHRPLGRRRRAARQPGRHAAAGRVRRRRRLELRRPVRRTARPDHPLRAPHDTGSGAGSVVEPEVPTGLTEDRWIRAIEIRPSSVDGRRITHHALARLQQEEDEDALGAASDVGPGLLMEWAVGKQGEIMRPNSGKLLKAGSSIVWDIHYHAVGEEITDTVELGLYLYPKDEVPEHRQVLASFSTIEGGGDHLSIPPNAISMTERFHVLKQNGRVENYQPHMHLRGKGMQMTAILPDGTTEVLSRVSDFNFNWHNNYVYTDHAAPLLPKGTVLHLKSWYDNTSANRANPDPNQWVGYGDRTVDEMGHAWVNVTYLDDDDFAAAVAEREALTTNNDN